MDVDFSRKVCVHLNASPFRDQSPLSGGDRIRERGDGAALDFSPGGKS